MHSVCTFRSVQIYRNKNKVKNERNSISSLYLNATILIFLTDATSMTRSMVPNRLMQHLIKITSLL
jgi:hypothetical protein